MTATRILLINPNTSVATTAMMVAIAEAAAPAGVEIVGTTAPDGPTMITDVAALAAAAPQVVALGVGLGAGFSGIIVSAFGDPGLAELRRRVAIPVVGIAEAAMLAAAESGRRFGVATTTPELRASIDAKAAELGLAHCYAGTRLTPGNPFDVVADPGQLVAALRLAVSACIEQDGARAVIIGGGPLGHAATALAPMFAIPVIAPIPAAVRRLLALVGR